MKRLVALSLCVVAGTALGARAQDQSRTKKELIEASKEMAGVFVRHDHAAMEKLLHERFLSVDRLGGVHEKVEHVGHLRAGRIRFESVQPDHFQMEVHGDVGVVVFRSETRGRVMGKTVTTPVRALQVFRKQGGQWLCVAQSYTPIAPASAK